MTQGRGTFDALYDNTRKTIKTIVKPKPPTKPQVKVRPQGRGK